MKLKARTLVMSFPALLALACGNSPLLNHVNAEDLKSQKAAAAAPAEQSEQETPVPAENAPSVPAGETPPSVPGSQGGETAITSDPSPTASPAPSPVPSPTPKSCDQEWKKPGLCMGLTWVQMPTDEDEGEFTLRFWEKETGSADGPYASVPGDLKVLLWMPDMGHGSSPVRVKQAADANGQPLPGEYQVTRVYFTMPGAWEIRVQLKKEGKVVDEAAFPIDI